MNIDKRLFAIAGIALVIAFGIWLYPKSTKQDTTTPTQVTERELQRDVLRF